jgi:hypothetical protein
LGGGGAYIIQNSILFQISFSNPFYYGYGSK